ncbi:MAG: DUF177 domain-containing protein [Chloroflexi bacterium]|nr:DUF177 domain-containing protein [Chloroflexota bacterium]
MSLQLQVNVAQLLKDAVGATRTFEVDGPELESDDGSPACVQGKLRLTRTDRGVWVSGSVTFSSDYVCSRCLAPFASWGEAKVDDVFLPNVDIATGAKLRYHDDGSGADLNSIDEQHVLDLTDTLRQYRLAAIPMAPVCREDCKGICPECGTNLNEVACSCERYQDQRWTVLRELLE